MDSTRNHAINLLRARVLVTHCDLVWLDKHWEARVLAELRSSALSARPPLFQQPDRGLLEKLGKPLPPERLDDESPASQRGIHPVLAGSSQ